MNTGKSVSSALTPPASATGKTPTEQTGVNVKTYDSINKNLATSNVTTGTAQQTLKTVAAPTDV